MAGFHLEFKHVDLQFLRDGLGRLVVTYIQSAWIITMGELCEEKTEQYDLHFVDEKNRVYDSNDKEKLY